MGGFIARIHASQSRETQTFRAMILDLCLYRVVSERCGGKVLPFGVRELIKAYAFTTIFTNKTLKEAVSLWCTDREAARTLYGDINDWDVSQVTSMDNLFCGREYRSFNDAIDRWDVSQVTSMCGMFNEAFAFNQPLASWDVSRVTNMHSMFFLALTFNQPLASWDTSRVVTMACMFADAEHFNQPLPTVSALERYRTSIAPSDASLPSRWNVSSVKDMSWMFRDAVSFNQPLNTWDVRHVECMYGMFASAMVFDQPLDRWDVRRVTNMGQMFSGAQRFNQPLATWDVRRVTNMIEMFFRAEAFNQPLLAWRVDPQVTDVMGIIVGAVSFHQPLGWLDTPVAYDADALGQERVRRRMRPATRTDP